MSSARSWLLAILSIGLSLVVGIVVIEILLRIIGIGYPTFTQLDSQTGFSLRPGASGWQTDEGKAYIAINSFGMRDKEYSLKKPANTLRIAVLGDSFTEGRQVDLEETFPRMMESDLASCSSLNDQKVEVLNFGVSGFGTTQELLQLKDRVWQFEPDIVLLAFTTGNDVRNNSYALEKSDQKPYIKKENGLYVLDTSFQQSPFYLKQQTLKHRFSSFVLRHSRILQLVRRVMAGAQQRAAEPSQATAGQEIGIDDAIYKNPEGDWIEAWDITEYVLGEIAKDVRSHSAQFAVVTLSNSIQVHPDPAVRVAFIKNLGVTDLFTPERKLTEIASRLQVPILTLAEPLQAEAERTGTFFHGFEKFGLGSGHWNEAGHKEAGKRIANFLCNTVESST